MTKTEVKSRLGGLKDDSTHGHSGTSPNSRPRNSGTTFLLASDGELQHIQRTQRTKKAALNQPCHYYTAAVIT